MRILWLKTELLHPIDKGGKIRTYNMLRELKRDHQVTYLTLDDGTTGANERERAQEYCHELVSIPHRRHAKFTMSFYVELLLNLLSPLPYAVKKYKSSSLRQEIAKRVEMCVFDVVVCDFLAPAINVPLNLSCPAILFQHNVEAMIWKRHYEVQHNPLKKSYLMGQWRKMRRFEGEMCSRFDSVIAVSLEDRQQMQHDYSVTRAFDVPTGVDTEFFRPSGAEKIDPHNIVFTGSMDWLPNQDAIRYFVTKILPAIKQAVPRATLTVVGRNPDPGLAELSRREPSVVFTGWVADVRPYIERAAAYVVPLRIGGGTRLKIFEAMAMEKAIVSTTVGAEGLPLSQGVELLLADEPESFAAAVVRLLLDRELATRIGLTAASTVRSKFGWDKVAESFALICQRTIDDETTRLSAASSDEKAPAAV